MSDRRSRRLSAKRPVEIEVDGKKYFGEYSVAGNGPSAMVSVTSLHGRPRHAQKGRLLEEHLAKLLLGEIVSER